MNDAVMLAALGIVSACVAGLIWVIKRMFNDILPALKNLTKATELNTSATQSADTYLKARNGRDIEKHAELLKATQAIPDTLKRIADDQASAIIKAVTVQENIKEQHVGMQNVEHLHMDKATESSTA